LLPLQDRAAARLLAALPEGDRLAAWRLAEPEGRLLSRGAAVAALLEQLGAGRAAALARRAPAALDRLYDLVARHRGALGGLVPDGPAPRRYP
jgi:predicted DCC family thiol-disulfide oxidoreductase YuxK